MKIKLINPPNKNLKATEQILVNRGISLETAYHYLNTTDEDISSPLEFGEDKMKSCYPRSFQLDLFVCHIDGNAV